MILMLFQPESPRWLLKSGRDERAIKNLVMIRQLPADDPYILWEAETVKEQLQREYDMGANQSFFKKLKEAFSVGNRIRVIMGMALMMLQTSLVSMP